MYATMLTQKFQTAVGSYGTRMMVIRIGSDRQILLIYDDDIDDDGSYDPPELKTLLELRYPLYATRLTQLSLTNKGAFNLTTAWPRQLLCLQSNSIV